MFTDIVGYTALMQQNEEKAAAIRTRHRQVFEKLHQQHQGEILQYFGDGTLSIFSSGVEAVTCAIAIQRNLQEGIQVPLRIGLHIGDIVFDGTEIYGASVNMAFRIESMGVGGAVLLSGRLNEELINHPDIQTISLGHFEFKNIDQPTEVYAACNPGLKVPVSKELKGKQKYTTKSIAVLPFINRSNDPENEYFSDGMTEEIINALSKIKGLKVTSRTSSFFFKNKKIPIQQIGNELNVTTLLEGSIRLAGKKMRITAQLIDVEGDFHFWSETFDRSVENIFAVQDEISLLIADKLREYLGHFEIEEQLVKAPQISVTLYNRYLKSRYYLLKMTKPDIEKGISLLEEILRQQPRFALAHLGMHLGYTLLGTIGLMPSNDAFAKGHPYLEKAIELGEDLPETQLHLAYISFLQDWDFEKAYQHLNQSFQIRPTVEFYQSMASVLVAERKFTAALHYMDTALQIDPISAINYHLKGFIFYLQEKYEQAIELFDKAVELNPYFMASTLYKGQSILLSGQKTKGLNYFQELPADGNQDVMRLGGETLAHAFLGNLQETEKGIKQLEEVLDTDLMERAMNLLVLCLCQLKQYEASLQLMETGFKNRLPMMVYLYGEPLLKPLRAHPRFQKMMRTVFGQNTSFDFSKKKYKKPLLDEVALKKYKKQLEKLMLEEKPYLNPDLTLRDLASKLELSPNYLSRLLNESFDKNFSEFVNSYRLEAFKSMAALPSNKGFTILALAYDSGFNSKTVFNTFFKKTMGKTPKAYLKEVAS